MTLIVINFGHASSWS